MTQRAYPHYSYYSMYGAPHTPYMGGAPPPAGPSGYPPFYGPPQPHPAPPNSNPPAPSPYSFDPESYLSNGPAPTQQPSRQPRRTNTFSGQPLTPYRHSTGAPLKSAMKKTITAFTNAESSTKHFFNSFNPQQSPAHTPATRPRAYSNPTNPRNSLVDESIEASDNPFHMIVSFHGYNELHVERILKRALDEMRKVIWPLWPDGIDSEVVTGHTCITRFKNSPWDLSGPNVKHAYKLIAEFFRLFQQRGYSFQTAIDVGTTTPRFLFQVTKPDDSEFFVAFFSQEKKRLTLVHLPQSIELTLGARLRSVFERKVASVEAHDESFRVFEIRRKPNSSAPEVDPGVFFVEVLRILNQLGCHLDVAIPFSRRGPLGIRNHRELLVFKRITSGKS